MDKIPNLIHYIDLDGNSTNDLIIESWKKYYPDFILTKWSRNDIKTRITFYNTFKDKIDSLKTDEEKITIYKYLIIYQMGGLMIDPDIYCLDRLPNSLLKQRLLFVFDDETMTNTNIFTNKIIGAKSLDVFYNTVLSVINKENINDENIKKSATEFLGGELLSKIFNNVPKEEKDLIKLASSHYFFPIKSNDVYYRGHLKICGIVIKDYLNFKEFETPYFLKKPTVFLSLLIPCYNTNAKFLNECIDSIKHQEGKFTIEVIWIDDGSDEINSKIQLELLNKMLNESRNIIFKYYKNSKNMGVGYSLHKGSKLCNSDYIFRLDTDDTMSPLRMREQYAVLYSNDHIKICGGQLGIFKNDENDNKLISKTDAKTITFNDFMKKPRGQIAYHPCIAFKKSALFQVGNYNKKLKNLPEDVDLILRMLGKFKIIYNSEKIYVRHRLHPKQVTHFTESESDVNKKKMWENITKQFVVRTMQS